MRALTRVATPASEGQLLEIALGTTGAQLERVTRSWRNVLVAERSASAMLSRSLRRRTLADGSVVYTLRVPSEDSAVLDAALERARSIVLDGDGRPVETPEETELAAELVNGTPWLRAAADAFVLVAETFVAIGVGTPATGWPWSSTPMLDALEPRTDEPSRAAASERAGPCRSPEGQPLLAATALRRMCEASVVVMAHRGGLPVDLGRAARHASLRQRRLLAVRDAGCCRFPSCTQRRRLIPHHVRWWSRGGRTDLDNLVLLCRAHHRAVHEVGYTVVAQGGGRFRFGTPAGRTLPDTWRTTASGPSDAPRDDPAEVAARRHPVWGGERLDLRLLIDATVANTVLASGHRLPEVPVWRSPVWFGRRSAGHVRRRLTSGRPGLAQSAAERSGSRTPTRGGTHVSQPRQHAGRLDGGQHHVRRLPDQRSRAAARDALALLRRPRRGGARRRRRQGHVDDGHGSAVTYKDDRDPEYDSGTTGTTAH